MRCFACGGGGHGAGGCLGGGRGGRGFRPKPQAAWAAWEPYDSGVVGGKRGRASAFIVGAARSGAFTLGRAGLANEGVYVLAMPRGGYYVGKSMDIEARVRQHEGGSEGGALCAKGFIRRVAPVTPRQADTECWERTETLALMHRHGLGKVRGWLYTSRDLSPGQREHAFQQVCEKFDLCRTCGTAGHFAKACGGRERARFCFL